MSHVDDALRGAVTSVLLEPNPHGLRAAMRVKRSWLHHFIDPLIPIEEAEPGDPCGMRLEYDGHVFDITKLRTIGWNTGRPRFKVACITCDYLESASTAGPAFYLDLHIQQAPKLGELRQLSPTELRNVRSDISRVVRGEKPITKTVIDALEAEGRYV